MSTEPPPVDTRDVGSPRPKQAADLLAEGWTRRDIWEQVRAGHLIRLRRGTYVAGDAGPTPEARHRMLIRAVVGCRPDAVVSHASAAVLHGLPVPARLLERCQLVSQSTFPGSATGDSYQLRRRRTLGDVTDVDGIPVTSLEQTFADACRLMSMPDAVALADAALRRRASRETCLAILESEPRRRGTPVARRAMLFADPRSESPGESWSRWSMHQLELPPPVLQQEFDLDDRKARTDFWWPDEMVAGEFDGMTKYGRLLKPGQKVEDVVMAEKQREVAFRRKGIWVVRWTTRDLMNPQQFRRIILEGLGRSAA